MLGFIVSYTVSKVLCDGDGHYNEKCFVPEVIREEFCLSFDDAMKKYNDNLKPKKDYSWYPGYVHDYENNKVFFRIVHEESYLRWLYRTTLQIKQCFYDKKEAD